MGHKNNAGRYTAEWMMDHMPALPKNFEKQANDTALKGSRYLFCHRERGKRYGYCTHCCRQGKVRDADLLTPVGQYGRCVFCNSQVMIKDVGRKRGKMLDKGYIYLMQKCWGGVVVRAAIAWRDYRESYEDVPTRFDEQYRVFFKAGMVAAYRKVWIYDQANKDWERFWERQKRIPDPQPQKVWAWYAMYSTVMDSGMIGVKQKTLEGTGLERCQLDLFRHQPGYADNLPSICKYLELHAKHTVLAERMEKEGFFHVIRDKANYGGVSGLYKQPRWNALTVSKALGLDKGQLRAAKQEKDVVHAIAWRQFCAAHGINKPDAREYVRENWDDIIQWDTHEEAVPVVKMIAYLRKQATIRERDLERCCHRANIRPEISVIEYRDYIQQCKRLNLDMQDPDVLYPRNMIQEHQRLTDIENARRTEQQRIRDEEQKKRNKERKEALERAEKAFAKNLPKLKRLYDWEHGSFLIRVAESEEDLATEGKSLGHCVHSSYAEKHLGRKTLILFVRRTEAPDTPFFTVEWNEADEKIIQCRGKKNCAPPDDVKNFLEDWNYEMHKFSRHKNQSEVRLAA